MVLDPHIIPTGTGPGQLICQAPSYRESGSNTAACTGVMRADSRLAAPPLALLRSGSTTGVKHLQGAARGRAAPAPQSQKNLRQHTRVAHVIHGKEEVMTECM
jgi:hypothetical protein